MNKAITTSELQNFEIRIKSEMKEAEKTDRHNLDNKINVFFYKVEDLEKKSAVNDNILKNMTISIEKLEKSIENWFKEINTKMDSFPEKFATKEDHKRNEERIIDLEKDRKNILVETAKWFILTFLWIWVAFLMYKLWLK